ncbi:hypothetical protein IW261DRAFT_524892 [Armillaria novae-zelandiae]|uniref:DUF6535 domain-containing protein n=1 Tax=Armillaria novae-zelandiae TaxID=153914 RepID=A0AA39NZI6_9AGAR|nr:hypothetical protein IW261DRAFT_524892 [Armillaria novae-zelandiae]
MSDLDPGQDAVIVRGDAEADSQGIGESGEHPHNSAEHEVELDEAAGEQEQDEGPVSAPPPSANPATAKTVFGMKKRTTTQQKANDASDYEQKYPPDPIYHETAPNARVWRVHEDESKKDDDNMVGTTREDLDLLLVFAGLFSAIVTTFVAQTYQNLQPDYAAMSASLLYESVLIQRAVAIGSPVDSIAPSPLNPTIAFVPATMDVWVNGLWFISLFLSLTTALVAFLVNQWIRYYVALPSGTARDHSLTRQFRYVGFQEWRVKVIIGLLPVLMHLALAIFLVGLIIFLHPLQAALSWVICVGTVLLYTAYVVATILPIIFPQCPYQTPLCHLIYISFCHIVPRVTWASYHKQSFISLYRQRDFKAMFYYLCHICMQARPSQSLSMIESKVVQETSIDLALKALPWLFSVSSNPTVQSIVIQSIGGLPLVAEKKLQALQGPMQSVQFPLLQSHLHSLEQALVQPVPGMELGLERLLRFDYRNDYFSQISFNIDLFELSVASICSGTSIIKGGAAAVLPVAFSMDLLFGCASTSKLPPRSWFFLVKHAQQQDFSDPLDPDTNDHTNIFPLYICSAILHSFHSSTEDLIQDFNSPLVLDFNNALPYFRSTIYDDVLHMLSKYPKHPSLSEPSLPQSLKVIVMVTKFLLHRLSLPESDMFHTTICQSLDAVILKGTSLVTSYHETTALMAAVENIMTCTRPWFDTKQDYSDLWKHAMYLYGKLAKDAPSACSVHGLQPIIDSIQIEWDQPQPFIGGFKSDQLCQRLGELLSARVLVAFSAFHESKCLQFLGDHSFRYTSVAMVREYVTGILAMQQESDGAMDAESLQQHIDHLYEPKILFTACSILATHDIKSVDESAIKSDIMALVQLHPEDPAWEECRRKLNDLAENEDTKFFSNQHRVKWNMGLHLLNEEEIQAQKDNIRYAIDVLNDFFNGREHTEVS